MQSFLSKMANFFLLPFSAQSRIRNMSRVETMKTKPRNNQGEMTTQHIQGKTENPTQWIIPVGGI